MNDLDYPNRWADVRERKRRRTLIRLNNILLATVVVLSVVGYILIIQH